MSEPPSEITVGMRVDDMPRSVPGSVERECGKCGSNVWISPATRSEIEQGQYPDEIRCVRCVTDEI